MGGWGKILGTLARTNAGSQYGLVFTVQDLLIGAYSPERAMLLSVLLEWACFVWLGLLIYLLNRHIRKMSGIFAAAVFVLLDLTIANELTPSAYHLSPITLAQLSAFSGMNARHGITLAYAVKFFAFGIAILIAVNLILSRRKANVQW